MARGRTVGQVLQQFWKKVGADAEIEQVEQTAVAARGFTRQFQITPWRIPDSRIRSRASMRCSTGSAFALSQYSNPELGGLIDVSDAWLE